MRKIIGYLLLNSSINRCIRNSLKSLGVNLVREVEVKREAILSWKILTKIIKIMVVLGIYSINKVMGIGKGYNLTRRSLKRLYSFRISIISMMIAILWRMSINIYNNNCKLSNRSKGLHLPTLK